MNQMEKIANSDLKTLMRLAQKTPGLKKYLKLRTPQIGFTLVGQSQMQKLNTHYRGKRKPTDVLSFPAHPVFREVGVLGEIVICTEVMKKQARERGHSTERELTILVIHGFLHLLGFDHEKSPAQERLQRSWEEKLMKLLDGKPKLG